MIKDSNQINNIAVIGAGTMGIGIAQNFAQAGISVKLVDVLSEKLASSLDQIESNLRVFQEFHLIQEDPHDIVSRISPALFSEFGKILGKCDYVVETIPEILEEKKTILKNIEQINEDIIISSNTGSFQVTELAQGMKNPGRVIGVHYFNPAHIIPAVEIHAGEKTSPETLEITRNLMVRVGKIPVLVRKELPGFIINRLTGALEREIGFLLDEGVVTPEDLDAAIKASIGFRLACLGPMETEDMIGLDTSVRVSRRLFKVLNNATEPSPELVSRVNQGMLGVKSGKGWYDYTGKSMATVLDSQNKKLLRQLYLFNMLNKKSE
jgi:3-hydroxybutyryl-CoA dehydrogenase